MDDSKDRFRVHAVITGIVQGVAFRYYTRREGLRLGIGGWVRNLPDGSVELEAQGTKKNLEALLAWCKKGPPSASVDDVLVSWKEPGKEFQGFVIRH